MPYYKHMFQPGEVILIYFQETPSLFARVESVSPDVKKNWWRMEFLPLVLPLQPITWILDDDQMHGAGFTMDKNPVRIERVESPLTSQEKPPAPKPPKEKGGGKVVSLFDDPDQ